MHLIWIGKEFAGGIVTRIYKNGVAITVDGSTKIISLSEAERLV